MAKSNKTKAAALDAARELFRAWGRQGGKKGAKARWSGVSAGERRALARKAAAARWSHRKSQS